MGSAGVLARTQTSDNDGTEKFFRTEVGKGKGAEATFVGAQVERRCGCGEEEEKKEGLEHDWL